MSVRLFHTADVHLGLKFTRGGYPDGLRDRLVAQRLETLRTMVDTANARDCGLFVVAGDLFDHPRVPKGLVREAAAALARFEGVVAVLPGNHDYAQEDDPVWPVFEDALGEGHHVLRRPQPCDLSGAGIPAVLYPGVCGSRHSQVNSIGWIPSTVEAESGTGGEGRFRIGIAHGSLEGLSPDFAGDYFPMTRAELEAARMDVWLLGHTHVRFPDRDRIEGERILFPASPEPDGFDCRHGGHAWIVELAEGGKMTAESFPTGTFRFHDVDLAIAGEGDLETLDRRLAGLDPDRDLVKLRLTGRVSDEIHEAVGERLDALEARTLYLEDDRTGLLREIRREDIDREYTEGSFPHRLLRGLSGGGEGADPEALQLAWELVEEARSLT